VKRPLLDVGEHNPAACLSERATERQTDAAGTAGDEGRLVLEVAHLVGEALPLGAAIARAIEKDQEQPIEIPGFWSSKAAKSSRDRQDEPAFEMARAVGNAEIPSEQGIFGDLTGKRPSTISNPTLSEQAVAERIWVHDTFSSRAAGKLRAGGAQRNPPW
jgi:hypothetical protein